MKTEKIHLGIDVSKKKLDIFNPVTNQVITLENNTSSFRKIRDITRKYGAIVCCEPTGGLEIELLLFLQKFDVPVAYCDGFRVRHFAMSCGQFAKNDTNDARMISKFADSVEPRLLTRQDKRLLLLRSRLSLYRAFIAAHVAMAQKASATNDCEVKAILQTESKRLRSKAISILAKCVAIIKEDEFLAKRFDRFMEIDGVGEVTAITVIAEMPQIGTLSDSQAAKLAGVAPLDNQSGNTERTKHIRGGRRTIREALYMAAVSAIKNNHILSAYYYKAKERMPGPKASKWAMVPIMRKLIHLMNRLARNPEFELEKKPRIKAA